MSLWSRRCHAVSSKCIYDFRIRKETYVCENKKGKLPFSVGEISEGIHRQGLSELRSPAYLVLMTGESKGDEGHQEVYSGKVPVAGREWGRMVTGVQSQAKECWDSRLVTVHRRMTESTCWFSEQLVIDASLSGELLQKDPWRAPGAQSKRLWQTDFQWVLEMNRS